MSNRLSWLWNFLKRAVTALPLGLGWGSLLRFGLKYGVPAYFGYKLLAGGKKETPQLTALPKEQPLTKERFEQVKAQILSALKQNPQTSFLGQDYFDQALALPEQMSTQVTDLLSALGKNTKRQSKQLLSVLRALPLVSQTGVGYWNQPLVQQLENSITNLIHQAIPTDLSWKSLLKAKYARRALQSLLPTYSNLVYASRYSISPSAIVPNALVSAFELENMPIQSALSALPNLYNLRMKGLLGAGESLLSAQTERELQQQKARDTLLNTLLKNQATLESTALKVLGSLGAVDESVKQLLLRRLSPYTGALMR